MVDSLKMLVKFGSPLKLPYSNAHYQYYQHTMRFTTALQVCALAIAITLTSVNAMCEGYTCYWGVGPNVQFARSME